MYEGFFRDDHPAGEFKRYDEKGILRSVLIFSEDGREADASIFYPEGNLASKGKFVDRKKEGKWQFFSRDSGYLISEDIYKGNLRNGLSVKFYPDSSIAERITYADNIKNGEWIHFHPNNNKWIRSNYLNGRLNGKFEAWFENGGIEFSGQYKYDIRDGVWQIFNKNGSVRYRIEYTNGVPDNRQLDIDASNYMDSLEKNKGKIPDPETAGDIW